VTTGPVQTSNQSTTTWFIDADYHPNTSVKTQKEQSSCTDK